MASERMVYRQGFNINKKKRVKKKIKKVFPFLSNLKPVVLLLSQFNSDTNH